MSSAVFTSVLFKEPRTGIETNSEFEYSHPMWVLSHHYDFKSTEKFYFLHISKCFAESEASHTEAPIHIKHQS